jgi:hypothetical protein
MTVRERQVLLEQYRKGATERVRLRAHMLLLLTEGYSWALIAGVWFYSPRTIGRGKSRVAREGIAAAGAPAASPPEGAEREWRARVAFWVTQLRPCDFGFVRSRWGCGLLVLVLRER